MFSQSFESMINMVNIPPLVFFLLGSKDRRQNRKLEMKVENGLICQYVYRNR